MTDNKKIPKEPVQPNVEIPNNVLDDWEGFDNTQPDPLDELWGDAE